MQFSPDAFKDLSQPLDLDPRGYFGRFLLERRRDHYEVTHQGAESDVSCDERGDGEPWPEACPDEIATIVGREANDHAVTLHSVR